MNRGFGMVFPCMNSATGILTSHSSFNMQPMSSDHRHWTVCTLILLLALASGSVGPVVAQTISVRGNVGATFFRSPETTKRILNSGSNLGIGMDLRVARGFSVALEGMYNSFSLNENNARIRDVNGADRSFIGGAASLRYTLINSSDAHPYITLGGGLHQLRTSNHKQSTDHTLSSTDESTQDLQESAHLALGSQFRIDDTYAVFAEPRYVFFNIDQGLGEAVRYFTLRLGMDVRL